MLRPALGLILLLAALAAVRGRELVVVQVVVLVVTLEMAAGVLEPTAPVVLAMLAVALLVAEAKLFIYTVLLVLPLGVELVFMEKALQERADQAEFVTQNPEAVAVARVAQTGGIVLAAFTAVAVLDNRL